MSQSKKTNTSIWRNSDFVKFFLSFSIGNLGDWFDFFALQIIIVHRFGASPFDVSLLIVAYMAPFALFSIFSGIIADHFNKKWLLFFTDIIGGLLTVGMIFAPSTLILMVLIFIRSTIGNVNAPTQQAAVKVLVTEAQLLKASAYNGMTFQLCRIIGPLLGAIIIAHYSALTCVGVNAVSFFVSAAIILSLNGDKLKRCAATDEAAQHKGVIGQARYAYNTISKNTVLATAMIIILLAFPLIMMAESQAVILLHAIFPQHENLLGFVVGMTGIGAILSGGILSQKEKLTQYWAYLMSGFIIAGCGYLVMADFQAHWPMVILYAAALVQGVGVGILFIIYDYMLKREVSADVMGRVLGILGMVQGAMLLAGGLSSGIITTFIGARCTFFVIAMSYLLLAIVSGCRYQTLRVCNPQQI